MRIPFTGGLYEDLSAPAGVQLCTNMYPDVAQTDTPYKEKLLHTPGITQLVTTGSGSAHINRGSHVMSGIPYFVNGASLYRLNQLTETTFDTTNLGTISGTPRVSMADNGTQLMILVPGGSGYIYDSTNGLQEITDSDFTANGNPQHVVYVDGYFVITTDSKKSIISLR